LESPAGHRTRSSAVPAELHGAVLVGLCLVSLVVGFLVTRQPDLLHFDVRFDALQLVCAATLLALCVVILRHPGAGLSLLVAFVFLNLSQVLVRFHSLPSVLQFITLALVATAWLKRDPGISARWLNPLVLALLSYTAVVFVSTAHARDRTLADESAVEALKAFVLFSLIVALTVNRGRLRAAFWTVAASAAFLSALGVWQVSMGAYDQQFGGLARVKHAHLYDGIFEARIAGPLGDPNFFAQSLLLAFPLALYLWHAERSWPKRVVALGLAGLSASAVALTYSRGAALTLAAILALWLWDRKPSWRTLAGGAVLLALAATFVPSVLYSRLATMREIVPGDHDLVHPDSSFAKRRFLLLGAWGIFQDHPLAGVGAGNFTVYFEEYADEVGFAAVEYDDPEQRSYAHNLYLEIASETGLIGLIVFGAVVAWSFRLASAARRRFVEARDVYLASLTRGLQVSLAGYLVSSLFLHGHHLRYLWLLFALIAAAWLLAARIALPAQSRRASPAVSMA